MKKKFHPHIEEAYRRRKKKNRPTPRKKISKFKWMMWTFVIFIAISIVILVTLAPLLPVELAAIIVPLLAMIIGIPMLFVSLALYHGYSGEEYEETKLF